MSSSLCNLGLAALLVFAAPRAEEVRFGVAQGAKVTKTFEVELDADLEELKVSVGGQEMPHGIEIEMHIQTKSKLVFTDTYREMGDGRPKVLARKFDLLTSSESQHVTTPAGERDESREEESALEGQTVVFTWSDESDGFEPEFDPESDGDEKLLEGLVEDIDLRRFLPGKEVAVDDTWEIDPKELARVLDPGGDVELRSEDDDEFDEEIQDELLESCTGDCKATFKGFRDEEGVRVAAIALSGELEMHGDADKGAEGNESFEVSLELEGELLWDVAAKRARSLSVSGPARLVVTQGGTGESEEGDAIEFAQEFLIAGTMTVRASWEAAD